MISDDILNIAELMRREAVVGRSLPPPRTAALATALLELSKQVLAMEDRPVSPLKRQPLRARATANA